METTNPCLTCGACCACYRASFYWAEADDAPSGTVPVEMTDKMNDFRRMMKGTGGSNPRCIALMGVIGERVYCAIHERRSSVCRDFPVAWENGEPNPRCDAARLRWGMEPLKPPVRENPDGFPSLPRTA